ncbi:two-partner secretion domain-containing protein [Anaerospora hongkongensis]|uniref:two-partner secretion domain-containing protein n=1 Tax=Anaerospora hongkongensis TaxID=244830 RepID=UPI00289FB4BA|nr:hemagglutinin repeat-containing protein [Anaerospora hongkongensis]
MLIQQTKKKKVKHKLLAWFTLAMFTAQPALVMAQAVADPNAAVANRPAIENAQNNVPIVQIAAPSAAGVSHNLYQQLNIDPNGLIFNNSLGITSTQLAGYIAANPNLKGSAARIILNEVTGTGASYLNGYAEIAGQKADLIIANPNGIVGDGFGFINANRAVLTTGTPVFGGSGSLEAFLVTRGQITVQGEGIDATGAARLDLLSRAAAINAGLWAKDLNVVTGANQVGYDQLQTNAITGEGVQPTVALDVSALGGMYANKIKLVGTEKGVGVNSQGTLAASSGDLTLTQEGKITLGGTVSAAGNLAIASCENITNSGTLYAGTNSSINSDGEINNQGTIAAGKHTNVTAGALVSTGTLAAGIDSTGKLGVEGDLTVTASGAVQATGQNLAGNTITMNGTSLGLSGSTTYAKEDVVLTATAGDIRNSGGTLAGGRAVSVSAAENMINDGGQIQSAGVLELVARDYSNKQGELSAGQQASLQVNQLDNQAGIIRSGRDLSLMTDGQVDNQEGQIEAGGALQLRAGSLDNQSGRITSLDDSGAILTIRNGLNNTAGIIGANGAVIVSGQELNNAGGTVTAVEALTVTIAGDIENEAGQIASGSGVILKAGKIENGSGQITAAQDLTVEAESLNSKGQLVAGRDINAVTEEKVVNQGTIQAGANLRIDSAAIENTGILQAKNNIRITAAQQVEGSGTVAAGNNLDITANRVAVSGLLAAGIQADGSMGTSGSLTVKATGEMKATGQNLAGADLGISGESIDLSGANTQAGSDIMLVAAQGDIRNTTGEIVAGRRLTIDAAGSLMNDEGSINAGQLTVGAGSLSNHKGMIRQSGTEKSTLVVDEKLDNSLGEISVNADELTITAASLDNTQGTIAQAGTGQLTVQAGQELNNSSGQIAGNGQANIDAVNIDNNGGSIYAQKQLELRAFLLQNQQGQIVGRQQANLTAQHIHNEKGLLEAGQGLTIAAQTVANDNGEIISLDASGLAVDVTGVLSNAAGLIGGNGAVRVSANKIDNTSGRMSAKSDLSIESVNELNNKSGILVAGSNLIVTQSEGLFHNEAGSVQAGNNLTIAASNAEVIGGSIVAGNTVNVDAKNLTVNTLQSGAETAIKAVQDFTNDGQVQAKGELRIAAGGKVTNSGSMTGLEKVSIAGTDLTNAAGAAVKSGGKLEVSGSTIANEGTVYGKDAVTVSVEDQLITSGTIASDTNVVLSAKAIHSTGSLAAGLAADGSVGVSGNLTLDAVEELAATGQHLAGGSIVIKGSRVDLSDATTQANQSVTIAASAGDVITSGGALTAKEIIAIEAAGSLVNEEAVIKGNKLTLEAASIRNRSGVLAQFGGEVLAIRTGELDNTSGKIAVNSENLSLEAERISNNHGVIQHAGSGKLSMEAENIVDNEGGQVISNGQVTISAARVDNSHGVLYSQKNVDIRSDELRNRQGQIVGKQAVAIAAAVDNTDGLVEADNSLNISGQKLINDEGKLTSLDTSGVTVDISGKLSNIAGLIGGNGAVHVSADYIDNTDGQVSAKTNLIVENNTGLDNTGGVLAAGNDLLLVQETGNLANGDGILQAGNNLRIAAKGVDIAGGSMVAGKAANISAKNLTIEGLQAGADAAVETEQDFTNAGQVQANGELSVVAGGKVTNAGSMTGLKKVSVTGATVTNEKGAAIKSGGVLEVQGQAVDNQGTLYAQEAVAVTAQVQLTTAGTIAAGADVTLSGKSINSTGTLAAGLTNTGAIGDSGDLVLNAEEQITATGQNLAGNDIAIRGSSVNLSDAATQANRSVTVAASAGDVVTSGGELTAKETIDVTAQGSLINEEAVIKGAKVKIEAQNISNRGGVLAQFGQTDFGINTGILDNTSGQIASNSENLSIAVEQLYNNEGIIQHAGSGKLDIQAEETFDNAGGQVISNGQATISTDRLDNSQGTIYAQNQLAIRANRLANNQGQIVGKAKMDIQSAIIDNTQGLVEAGGSLSVSGQTVVNDGGKLTSLDTSGLLVEASDSLSNVAGLIGSNGAIHVLADTIDNTDGQVSAKTDLTIENTDGLNNRNGALVAGNNLTVTQTGGSLANESGTLQAGSNLTIAAGEADVLSGSFVAGKTANVSARNLTVSQLQAGKDVQISTRQDFTNAGQVQANGELSVTADGKVTNTGSMTGLEKVDISGTTVTNKSGAAIKSGSALAVKGQAVDNQGTLYAQGTVSITAQDQLTSGGTIAAGEDVVLSGKNINSTGTLAAGLTNTGAVGTNGNLTVIADETVTAVGQNLAGGNLKFRGTSIDLSGGTTYAGHTASITANTGEITNTEGSLSAKDSLSLSAKTKFNNSDGEVKANQLSLTAERIDNSGGLLAQYGQNDLVLTTKSLDNKGGQLAANSQNMTITAQEIDNSQGNIQHAGNGKLALTTVTGLANDSGHIISNGAVRVDASQLDNNQGTISAQGDLTAEINSLDNQSGILVSSGTIGLKLDQELDNQSGTVEAGKGLTISAASINNQGGKLTSLGQNDLSLNVQGGINNYTGLIGGNGTANIQANELDNNSGQIVSAGGLTATVQEGIDNTGGEISAGQDITLEQQNAALINEKGTIEAGRNLDINTKAIHNAQGKLAANTNTSLAFTTLTGAGSVSAGHNLDLNVHGDFSNAAGNTWQAANDFTLSANGTVTNSGAMEAGKNLNVIAQQVTNQAGASMVANEELNIQATGDVQNSGSLFGHDVKVAATNIVNESETAAIAAMDNVKLYATNELNNKDGALIYSMGNIDIAGNETKSNGEYAVRAKMLTNQSANIEADGDIVIYADDVVNKKSVFEVEQTVISDDMHPFEEGQTYYYLTLPDDNNDFLDHFKIKDYSYQGYSRVGYVDYANYILLLGTSDTKTIILKDSPMGKIIAGRDLLIQANNSINDNSWILAGHNLISYGNLDNKNLSNNNSRRKHYALVGINQFEDFPYVSMSIYVHAVYDEVVNESTPDTTTRFGGGQQVTIEGTSVSNVTFTPDSSVDQIKTIDTSGEVGSAASVQTSSQTVNTGINTSINGTAVENPTVGGIISAGLANNAVVVEAGAEIAVNTSLNTGVNGADIQGPTLSVESYSQPMNAAAVETAPSGNVNASIDTNVAAANPETSITSVTSGSSSGSISPVAPTESTGQTGIGSGGIDPSTVAALLPSAQTETVKVPQTNNGGTIILPQNGLYTIKTDPTATYLVETNPKFANYKNFISSDYLLGKLGYDPAETMKRLGDGFYEQKLVREQITDLTGRVYLNGYDSAEAQYQALLQNGAEAADTLNLTVGITLSDEQQTALQQDIVWLVEQEVDGQKVLVPVVYLSALRQNEVAVSGAIISADHVQINVTGDVINTGTIQAIESAKIGAANVSNIGGTINGGQLTQINADQDILNVSGKVSGNDISLIAGGTITSQTYSTVSENSYLSKTILGNTAAISADSSLTAIAGQDLNLLGTDISAGTDLSLSAQNINIGVVADTDKIKLGKVTEITTNLGTTITAGANLNLEAGNNISIEASDLKATGNLSVFAGTDLTLTAVADTSTSNYNINSYNFSNQSIVTNQLTSLDAGNNLTLVSGADMTLTGVQTSAGDNLAIAAGGDILLNAVKDSEFSDVKVGSSKNYNRVMTNDETVIGTNLAANKDLTIKTGSSLTMEGSSAVSENGKIAITAADDITIGAVTEIHEALTESKKTKSGFLSKKTTIKKDYSIVNEVVGSTISGDTVEIAAGTDLTVQAGNIVGTHDVNLTAGNDLSIVSAAETGATEHYKYTKKSGLFSGGGLGFTIGSQSEKSTLKEQTLGEIGSMVGSLEGNITLTAGNQVNSAGTAFISGQDLDITGKTVNIDNTVDTYDSQSKYEFKQSGLSVSLNGGSAQTAMNAVGNIERASQVSDERLQALYAYKAYEDVEKLSKIKDEAGAKKGVSVSVSIGSSKFTSEQTVHSETVNTSDINAGGTVTIKATEGDVNLSGVKLDAKDLTITAADNINIDAAQNKLQMDTNTSSSSWAVGASLGHTPSYFANASKGSGKESQDTVTQVGSLLNADGTIQLVTGKDLTISGSQVKGRSILADIGGDLNIVSLQDTDDYIAKNKNSGIGVSTGPSGGVTGSYSQGKTNSTYASVTEQAGIFAGEGGFDITVGGNTDLKGAVIASDADPDKNKLSTDTLTYSDIENKAEYSSSSTGVNLDTRKTADAKDAGLTPAIGTKATGDAGSTTKSAIAEGTIEVRNGDTDLSNLSRDTANSLNALGKIFDKKTVAEQQELAKVFGEVAFKAVGDLAESQANKATTDEERAKWLDGGEYKIALHALVGGIMSDMGGSNFASGVASAGLNEAIQDQLSKITNPALHQWASSLVGATAAKVVGGNAQSGASVAASGTKNNWLNHRQQMELAEKLSKAANDDERQKILEEYQALSQKNILSGVDPDTGLPVSRDPITGQAYEAIEPELLKVLNDLELPGTFGTVNYTTDNSGLNNNLAKARNSIYYGNETLELGKNIGESLVDTVVGEKIIDQLRTSFTIGKVTASNLGPATTLEIAVDTTPGSTIALKGVSKVFGGVVALGQVTYDVYVDYKTFGGFNGKFAVAAGLDVGSTVILGLSGGALVSFGAPVIAVSIGGGIIAYLVNKEVLEPLKEDLR